MHRTDGQQKEGLKATALEVVGTLLVQGRYDHLESERERERERLRESDEELELEELDE